MTKLMNTSQSDSIYILGCHSFTPRFYGLAVCLNYYSQQTAIYIFLYPQITNFSTKMLFH